MPTTALNAQQDPHCPWFLTDVTAPLVRQSIASGRAEVSALEKVDEASTDRGASSVRYFLYSSLVQSPKKFMPSVNECTPRAA